MRRLSLLLMIVLLGAPLAVCAQVYKWTDAHGTVHYSDSRPPHGVKYTRIKLAADTSQPAPTSVPATPDRATPETDATATPSANTNARVANTPANRQKLCANLSSNMTLLKGDKPVVMRGANGKNQLLSKQRKAQELAKAQQQYQTYCQGSASGA